MPDQIDHPTEHQFNAILNTEVPDFVSVYTNNVAVAMNFFDMALTFGEMRGPNEDGTKLLVDQRVRVTMHPSQAKILVAAMLEQLIQFEVKFGEIITPPGIALPGFGMQLLQTVTLAIKRTREQMEKSGVKAEESDEG